MPAALSLLVASAECCALLVRSERLRGVKAIHARAVPWRPGEGALARLAFPHRLALRGAVACADAGRAGWPAWAVRMRMRLPRRHSSPTSASMANRWRWQRRCDAQQAREPGSQPVSWTGRMRRTRTVRVRPGVRYLDNGRPYGTTRDLRPEPWIGDPPIHSSGLQSAASAQLRILSKQGPGS